MNCHVFIDFDGTLAPGDPTLSLLQRFAEKSWLQLDDEFEAGGLSSRECIARKIALLRATPEVYDAFIGTMSIDPHFRAFAALCERHGVAMTIVSDGPDRNIDLLLRKAGLEIPYFANRLEWLGGDRWQLGFPHARPACSMAAGNCKCQFSDRFPAATQIMIGDGRSDYCISQRVDLVLAKGELARHCEDRDLAHFAINDFRDATRLLKDWLTSGVVLSDGRLVEIGTAAA
jgi:2-hydroxy-3-keto-5-methylthiopentenyl-1-phosphate phosphatase